MHTSERSESVWWKWAAGLLPLALLLAAGLCVWGVTGYFRLSGDAAALRRSTMSALGGAWHTRLAVNIGGMTLALVRAGARFFPLQAEPRAALDTLRGAEVGIYELASGSVGAGPRSLFARVDQTMGRRGWQRLVGVRKEQDVVGVYIPRKGITARRMRACVVVWHERHLVVACVRGNLEPLLALAALRPDYLAFGTVRYRSSANGTAVSSQMRLGPAERMRTSVSEK